jgi:hypothetical protein
VHASLAYLNSVGNNRRTVQDENLRVLNLLLVTHSAAAAQYRGRPSMAKRSRVSQRDGKPGRARSGQARHSQQKCLIGSLKIVQ